MDEMDTVATNTRPLHQVNQVNPVNQVHPVHRPWRAMAKSKTAGPWGPAVWFVQAKATRITAWL
mgnify:CR=1 FL=1